MAVEAVVSVIIQQLTDMLIEESVVFDKVIIGQVEEIRNKLTQKRGFLIGAEENQGRDPQVKIWADNYLRILYQVEDITETFSVGIARQRERSNTRIGAIFNNYATLFFFFNSFKASRKLCRKMARIGTTIDLHNNEKPNMVRDASIKYLFSESSSFQDEDQSHQHDHQQNSFGHSGQAVKEEEEEEEQQQQPPEEQEKEEEIGGPTVSPIQASTSSAAQALTQRTLTTCFSYEEESGIIGFQDVVNALVRRLTSDEDDEGNILSIVGKVGSGKTTLAQAIYKSRGIKKYFKGRRAWVSVSKDYSKEDLLLNLLKQVEHSKDQGTPNPERLSKLLEKEKYLVVIDDVRTGDDWDKLKDAFPNTKNGSKFIVTSCDEPTALSADPRRRSRHDMQRLSDDESWTMFLKKARLPEASTHPSRNKILKICEGLPLWIALLGGYLSTTKHEWSKLLDHINSHSLDILSLCYIELPVHTKLCLLYMVLFPKEFDIPVRRLIRLWLAEGFVKRSSKMIPEDVAQEYFDNLVDRNVIQISKWRSDGRPRRCRLSGAVHDALLPKTDDIGLFHIHRHSGCNIEEATRGFGLRRIVEYLDIKNCPLRFSHLQYLRSYISFNLQKKDIPAREVADFVNKMTGRSRGFALLRVLDLEGVYKPSLPDKLGDLFHLKYLGLRWTFLDYLPPSVCDLPYLETLDLKRTCINSLPNSIWKLKHLRHLNLNEIRLDMPRKPLTEQSGLLTLWGLLVDDKTPVKNGLSRLRELRELGITFNLSSSSDLTDWISSLTNLQSLRLRSKDEMGRPSQLDLKSLSSLTKLSHLNLLGKLRKLPDNFPPGLKVLTLSISRLKDDPMPTLGKLPSLTVLRLLGNSYTGQTIVCPAGGFAQLRVFKLWMLKKLKDWDVEEGAMQNLKELNIRCCDSLRTLPLTLLHSSTLEELTLTNMPDNFVAEVWQQKSEHTSLTVNNWHFNPLPEAWEQDNDSE